MHTITQFINWILKVAKAIDRHKKDTTVQEQRRRSGEKKHTSGLTPDERRLKAARQKARQDYYHGAALFRGLQLHKGKGKAKGKGKHDHRLWPLEWHKMTRTQRWYVNEYRNGNLLQAMQGAQAQYQPRSADTPYFAMNDCLDESDAQSGASEHSWSTNL